MGLAWISVPVAPRSGSSPPIAGAALCFLEKRISVGSLTEDAVQDLNWVLASTIQKLIDDLGPDTLRSCLSQQELSRIERRLSGYGRLEFDPSVLRKRILSQLNNLSVLAVDPNLVSLAGKIEALFAAAARSDAKSNIARSALLYLADIADIVPDSYGLLGLFDDIYVIEWAYAVVEDQTRCLPLLEALIQKWPYVADLSIREGDPATLDRYNQYVAGVAPQCPRQRRQLRSLHLMPKHHPHPRHLEGLHKLLLARPRPDVALNKQHISSINPHLT